MKVAIIFASVLAVCVVLASAKPAPGIADDFTSMLKGAQESAAPAANSEGTEGAAVPSAEQVEEGQDSTDRFFDAVANMVAPMLSHGMSTAFKYIMG